VGQSVHSASGFNYSLLQRPLTRVQTRAWDYGLLYYGFEKRIQKKAPVMYCVEPSEVTALDDIYYVSACRATGEQQTTWIDLAAAGRRASCTWSNHQILAPSRLAFAPFLETLGAFSRAKDGACLRLQRQGTQWPLSVTLHYKEYFARHCITLTR
jgi:hypothetical protein